MTETALVQLLIDGSVTEETYCWNPDLTDWKPLIEVERFERWREHANELVKAAAAAEAAAAEAAAAEAAAAEAAAEELPSEADSAVAAETVAPVNNSGAAETTGSEVTSESTPDGVVTAQESTDIIPDEGLPHDEQRW